MLTKHRATINDLYAVPDNRKAELINGEIVLLMPTGDEPGYAGDEIFVSLREHARRTALRQSTPYSPANTALLLRCVKTAGHEEACDIFPVSLHAMPHLCG